MESIELDDSDIYVQTSITDELIKLMRIPYNSSEGVEEWYIKSISGEKYYWDIAIRNDGVDCYKAVADIDDVTEEEVELVLDAVAARFKQLRDDVPAPHNPFADMSDTPS